MKKAIQAISIVLIMFILASCTLPSEPAESDQPVLTEVSAYQPQATLTVTAKPSPAAATQQLVKEDIPAYLTAGLEKRSEMSTAMERYYYGLYYYQIFITFGRDPIEDFSLFNVDFDEMTSVDLDGDGKEETITLTGEVFDSEYPYYYNITIDIDGNKLELGNGNQYLFELNGVILDVNKDDGKKEILVWTSGMEEGWTDYIITYDDKPPRMIFDDNLFNENQPAEGTGYIVTQEVDNYLYYNVLWKLKDDRSAFEPVNNEYYPTDYQQHCWDENGSWDEGQAAETQSDQYLYKEPDGKEKVLVKRGTRVFIGLYAKNGRLMILDAKGELLGWLDSDMVDFNGYTGYAFDLGYD